LETHFPEKIAEIANEHALSYSACIEKIKIMYNGYSWDGLQSVYAPFSTLKFMSEMTFKNHWFSTGTPNFLLQLLRPTFQYEVEDFNLVGQPLTLDSSTETSAGWRYKTENAFLDSDTYWTNYDSSYTAGPQPSSAFIVWVSSFPSAYSKITLVQPAGNAIDFSVVATLEILVGATWAEVATTQATTVDGVGRYTFELVNPAYTRGWRVTWRRPSPGVPKIYVQNVQVSGVITLYKAPSGPSPLASLAIYEANLVPPEFTYCNLALVDITSSQTVERVEDTRYLIFRDYQPVSNWLTDFWDANLIDLYDQVSDYSNLWMSPDYCLRQEYEDLTRYGIYLPGEIPATNIIPS
jgi:hypothetical protein